MHSAAPRWRCYGADNQPNDGAAVGKLVSELSNNAQKTAFGSTYGVRYTNTKVLVNNGDKAGRSAVVNVATKKQTTVVPMMVPCPTRQPPLALSLRLMTVQLSVPMVMWM